MKSWLIVGALFVLCGVLGVLQYQWIGEVSARDADRRRAELETSLRRLSQDFNNEVGAAWRALAPAGASDAESARSDVEQRYDQATRTAHGVKVFRRIGLAVPKNDRAELELLDPATGQFEPANWPEDWAGMRARIAARLMAEMPPMGFRGEDESLVFETPIFRGGGRGRGRGGPGRDFGRREVGWFIFELNPDYLRDELLSEVVRRHLDLGQYHVEVMSRAHPRTLVWTSDGSARAGGAADAAIGILEPRFGPFFDGGRGRGGRGPGWAADGGRWTLLVRHRAGSLEAVVARTRQRNLAVTGGVLLLLMAAVWMLFRFTRDAQRLAHMQMDFVAGVSHELRTPLTAIYTAGHNLRGRLAQNPAQVERYGEMIQQESGRLRELVEQVLRFASVNAGRAIQAPTPVDVRSLIEETVESNRCALEGAKCRVEKQLGEALPQILADPLALKHALENLLANAMKYGAKEQPWIGVTASRTKDGVEIRVADRGPGIPLDEQKHIFDAFYRGRRAVQDQVHGAGLGLNLVKKIVEAHGGSIRVKSAPGEGAEFIVRLPAAATGA